MGLTSAREDTAHQADKVAEWLRRWTANPLCSARMQRRSDRVKRS